MTLTETLQKEAREVANKVTAELFVIGIAEKEELEQVHAIITTALKEVCAHTVRTTLEQVEREIGALHEIYDINDKPHISKEDALSIITTHKV